MPVALTMFFKEDSANLSSGWSETVYFAGEAIKPIFDTLFDAGSYPALRCNCLGAGVRNTYIRATVVPEGLRPPPPRRRASQPTIGLPPTGVGNFGAYYSPSAQNLKADFSPNAYMIRLATDPGVSPNYTKTYWLPCMPDDATGIELAAPSLPWVRTNLTVLLQAITGQGLFPQNQVLIPSIGRGPENPLKACTSFSASNQVFTVQAHGFSQGNEVQASGFRGPPGSVLPRGRYIVDNVGSADTFSLRGITQNMGPFTTLGAFRKYYMKFTLATVTTLRGFRTHKRGRPIDLSVGRQRSKTRQTA